MADIHDEVNEVVEDSDVEEFDAGLRLLVLEELNWVTQQSQRLVDEHDLDDYEAIELIDTVRNTALAKMRLLGLD